VDSTAYRNVLYFFVCTSYYESGFEFHVTENSFVHNTNKQVSKQTNKQAKNKQTNKQTNKLTNQLTNEQPTNKLNN